VYVSMCACVAVPLCVGHMSTFLQHFDLLAQISRSPIQEYMGRILHTGNAYIHTPTYVLGWIRRGQPCVGSRSQTLVESGILRARLTYGKNGGSYVYS